MKNNINCLLCGRTLERLSYKRYYCNECDKFCYTENGKLYTIVCAESDEVIESSLDEDEKRTKVA